MGGQFDVETVVAARRTAANPDGVVFDPERPGLVGLNSQGDRQFEPAVADFEHPVPGARDCGAPLDPQPQGPDSDRLFLRTGSVHRTNGGEYDGTQRPAQDVQQPGVHGGGIAGMPQRPQAPFGPAISSEGNKERLGEAGFYSCDWLCQEQFQGRHWAYEQYRR